MFELGEVYNYYGGKNVIVVGGAGMVGYKLVGLLFDAGANVTVIDNYSRGKNIYPEASYIMRDQRELYSSLRPVLGADALLFPGRTYKGIDANDIEFLASVMRYGKADIVFNLAASVAGVLHNEGNHIQMYHDNVGLLASPLRAAERAGVQAFLQTSSVCVYAEEYQSPCIEENGFRGEPHRANAGYAEAKRDGERMAQWSDLERIVIVRPSNIAGDCDYFDKKAHVIPAFIRRAYEIDDGEVFQAYGSPMIQREFIYNKDVALGMMYALAFGDDGAAYNVGTSRDNTASMLSLADKIIRAVARQTGIRKDNRIIFNNEYGGGDSVRYSDATKLQGLGWKHEVGLDDIIERAVEYFLEVVHKEEVYR